LSFCFANDNRMAPPSGLQFFSKYEPDDTQGHFDHFNMGTLGINFFMEVQEEGMWVEEEFV